MTVKEFAEHLKEYDEFCIVYHVRPDGDCIGSSFALALALQAIGKKCTVEGEYPVPRSHRILTDHVTLDKVENPVYIALDSCDLSRTGTYSDRKYTFCIDHHRGNSIPAKYKYVEEDCGACSEIILKIINEFVIDVTKPMADLLYMALVTDTLCFRTGDTDKQSFETAARLAECGADILGIGRRYMFVKSSQRMKIESILRDSLHLCCDGQLITGIITLADLKEADILDEELEGINSFVEQIDSMRIGITIRELPDGTTRCSMRTKGELSANEICRLFGGGGHFHAAACFLDTDVYRAREIMEKACIEILEKISE